MTKKHTQTHAHIRTHPHNVRCRMYSYPRLCLCVCLSLSAQKLQLNYSSETGLTYSAFRRFLYFDAIPHTSVYVDGGMSTRYPLCERCRLATQQSL